MTTPPVPYIAPWQASWNRYSTQIFNMRADTGQAATYDLTVGDGQWWRPLLHTIHWSTSSTVATRQAFFTISTPAGGVARFAWPTTQVASQTGNYTLGVGLTAFSTPVVTGVLFQMSPLVDLIWPQGTLFQSFLSNPQTGDTATSGGNIPQLTVEVYTENTDGTLTPVVSPTPLVT